MTAALPPAATVLVVEHDPDVAELVRRYLDRSGFTVRLAASPGEADAALSGGEPPAVVVLDTTMPDLDLPGFGARLDRWAPSAPVVLVTDGPIPQLGARPRALACVPRPFSPRLLVDRVTATLRSGATSPGRFQAGRVVVDLERRRVLAPDGEVALTPAEFDLLALLLQDPGRVRSRAELLAALRDRRPGDPQAGGRAVDAHVAQLRAKLGDACAIRTVRGVGYAAEA